MPRRKSPELAIRNEVIYAKWRSGRSLVALGEEYGRAPQVIGRIVSGFHPEGTEDDDRSLFRGYMWRLYDEVQEIAERPGWKMSPQGGAAYGPDGEPADDVMVSLQAKELQVKIIRELRLLDARDRPQPKQVQVLHELANSQAMADIAQKRAEMEELARRAGQPAVVPGEVLRPAIEG